MKKIIFFLLWCVSISLSANDNDSVQTALHSLKIETDNLSRSIESIKIEQRRLSSSVKTLTSGLSEYGLELDSVNSKAEANAVTIAGNQKCLVEKINSQEESLTNSIGSLTQSVVNKTTAFVIALIVLSALFAIYAFVVRKKSGDIDRLLKTIEESQKALESQSIKLDNQLIEILEKKMKSVSETQAKGDNRDHSLPLKIADEIVRIQNNIDRMSPDDKNVKRLILALERMKSSFSAYGYEIVDMRGQEYTDNMPFEVRFTHDDSIEEGKKIISGMDRLMVRYNGKMIQAPILAVRQNV